ncbi:unnamed protein product [Adineta steineri]|uniref:Spatacsin C-terminal domain-containing protein n=1 Tax=Adineta steineri TaxID=433720 RepID=A0A813QCG0_9BILA|nr:unnamed protein product [Adineta steineri]CAF0922218.1 unnamed protein product [Adineta steineri]
MHDERLNTALFDFITPHRPNDEHTFTSISMSLNMHHELAIRYRDAGKRLLKIFRFNQQTSSAHLSVTLQSLLQYHSDPADTFYLAECCCQSEQCLKQARLLSLQLELLPRFEHCWHAFIIDDAYNEHTL